MERLEQSEAVALHNVSGSGGQGEKKAGELGLDRSGPKQKAAPLRLLDTCLRHPERQLIHPVGHVPSVREHEQPPHHSGALGMPMQ